jgi:hypothetical protein
MSDFIQIVIGVLFLAVVYVLTRYGIYWRIKRACAFTVKDLERRNALDEKSAVELHYAKSNPLRIGMRDFRPKAVEYLVGQGVVGMTSEGKYYLKRGNPITERR